MPEELFDKEEYEAKVRKLFSNAEAYPEGHHLREAFLEKAYEMMESHHVKVAKDESQSKDTKVEHYKVEFSGLYAKDQSTLFYIIGKHFNCQTIGLQDGSTEIWGYDSDIDSTEFLYSIIEPQMFAELSKVRIPAGTHAKRVRNAFIKGYIFKINERLEEARKDRSKITEPGYAVALRDRSLAVQSDFRKKYPRTTQGRSTYSDRNAFASGQEAGARARFSANSEVGNRGRELGSGK